MEIYFIYLLFHKASMASSATEQTSATSVLFKNDTDKIIVDL